MADADPIKTGGAVEQKFTSSGSDDNDEEDIASKKHADVSPKPKNKRSTDDPSSSSTQSSYGTRGGYTEYKSKEKQKVNESKEKIFNMSLKDKRRLYKCKDKFITLDEIDTWPEYFDQDLKDQEVVNRWWKRNEKKVEYEIDNDLSNKISLFRGDITTLEIDAIANAANESLLGGGGVDGAIHSAAGIKLRSECELLDRCPAGEARITCGYKLPARHVIHTVGPRGEHPEKLESCYRESLKLLKENDLKSVAFPCISTGIFGYPNENAAKVALKTVRDWLENEEYSKNVERIIFCLFLEKDVEIYQEQLQLFFPLNRNDDSRSRSEETSF